ncbi:acyl-CoA N-acyltransferase [Mrakia frigida]|uniref:acyl-CoA N-acyltransferase n=1 Tax=Mrakia frigida TaxID=29902 RepID=UPI003FCC11CE
MASSSSSSSLSVAFPILINQDYSLHKGDSTRRCTILQSRLVPSSSTREFYVTYPGRDKRLDEWVGESVLMGPWRGASVEGGTTPTMMEKEEGEGEGVEKSKIERRSLESELGFVRKRKRAGGEGGGGGEQPSADPDIEHHLLTRVRNFNQVRYASFEISTWYFSPYPLSAAEDGPAPINSNGSKGGGGGGGRPTTSSKPPTTLPASLGAEGAVMGASKVLSIPRTTLRAHGRTSDLLAGGLGGGEEMGGRGDLFVCDGCFKYMREFDSYEGHRRLCKSSHPPGTLVYQKDGVSIWEVDGAKERLYCQNLSLFGKLFIDQKTIFYSAFTFYVMTDAKTSKSDFVVGFFSKEKISYDDYNLACIITFPPFQKKGFGRLMIEFSYCLTLQSPTPGTPERPLSDLGLKGYLSFWTSVLVSVLRTELEPLSDPPTTTRHPPVGLVTRHQKEEEQTLLTSKTIPLSLLASKARLRLDDVALTLQEAGLLRYRQGVVPFTREEGENVVVTREMVEKLASERRIRPPLLSLAHVRFNTGG